jgi:tetratricopeptide (TPR) repeat protein
MERAGALSLARTSLVALLGAAAAAGPAAHGVTLAHLGRVVRQMGELDAALTLYDAAAALAATAADDVLAARAAVGSGVIYGQRGNFPAARAAYKRALALAPARSPIAAGAHHGLMLAALAAGDLEDALGHAWRAFADAGDDADRRSEALCNLGGLCRRTGEHDAALHAFRAGLALTTNPRLRLGTLRNAALSAAQTGRRDLVVTFARETDAEIARVGQPYEVAQALLDLGESYRLVGDREEAAARLDTSRDLAAMHGFHEIVWRAETARAALGTARPAFDQPREAFAVWGGTAGGSARTVVQQVRGLPLVASELLALR